MKNIKIEKIKRYELPILLDMILELADYEDAIKEINSTVESLDKAIFETKVANVLMVYYEGETIGYAIYNFNFSTFTGKIGIYIDDLYIREAHRGKGFGKALFAYIGEIAKSNDCGRIDWYCMKTNHQSIQYYEHMGAELVEWVNIYRLNEEKIKNLNEEE